MGHGPDITGTDEERCLSTNTRWLLQVRKFSIYDNRNPLVPYDRALKEDAAGVTHCQRSY